MTAFLLNCFYVGIGVLAACCLALLLEGALRGGNRRRRWWRFERRWHLRPVGQMVLGCVGIWLAVAAFGAVCVWPGAAYAGLNVALGWVTGVWGLTLGGMAAVILLRRPLAAVISLALHALWLACRPLLKWEWRRRRGAVADLGAGSILSAKVWPGQALSAARVAEEAARCVPSRLELTSLPRAFEEAEHDRDGADPFRAVDEVQAALGLPLTAFDRREIHKALFAELRDAQWSVASARQTLCTDETEDALRTAATKITDALHCLEGLLERDNAELNPPRGAASALVNAEALTRWSAVETSNLSGEVAA